MEPTPELISDIERERLERARRMSAGERVRAGIELFDLWRRSVACYVRSRRPDATDEDIRREVLRRLNVIRALEESQGAGSPLYVDCEP